MRNTPKALLYLLGISLLLTTGLFIYDNLYDTPSEPDGIGTILFVGFIYTSLFFGLLSALYFAFRSLLPQRARIGR